MTLEAVDKKLLTIAVPTFNRARYLQLCLDRLRDQVSGNEDRVEVIVSDNCSPDDTGAVVEQAKRDGLPVHYVRNQENIGADRNFIQCFRMARTVYVLLLSDDDILLEGGLKRLLAVLETGDYGVVHLRSYGFSGDYNAERPKKSPDNIKVYDEVNDFIDDVNLMLTFVSGNIVNKDKVDPDLDLDAVARSNLAQFAWNLSAALNAEKNLYLDYYTVAAQRDNTGNYPLCTVFGRNLREILDGFVTKGVDPSWFRPFDREVVCRFLPPFLIRFKKDRGQFAAEDPYAMLYPAFSHYLPFWIILVPILRLPYLPAKLWYKACKRVLRLVGMG